MPAPNRAVVFDLDGLMFDTEALFFLLLTRQTCSWLASTTQRS